MPAGTTLAKSIAEQQGVGDPPVLYWSVRGEVACHAHAPPDQSARWIGERWAILPSALLDRRRVTYQCQHCASSGRALRRNPRVHSHE